MIHEHIINIFEAKDASKGDKIVSKNHTFPDKRGLRSKACDFFVLDAIGVPAYYAFCGVVRDRS